MTSIAPVTPWIGQLKAGAPAAAQHLWEGSTNAEVAARLGCVPRTVERKLRTIRRLWGQEGTP
jgi:hypothetical protein